MPDALGFGRRIDGPTGRRRAVRERTSLPVSLHSLTRLRFAANRSQPIQGATRMSPAGATHRNA